MKDKEFLDSILAIVKRTKPDDPMTVGKAFFDIKKLVLTWEVLSNKVGRK